VLQRRIKRPIRNNQGRDGDVAFMARLRRANNTVARPKAVAGV